MWKPSSEIVLGLPGKEVLRTVSVEDNWNPFNVNEIKHEKVFIYLKKYFLTGNKHHILDKSIDFSNLCPRLPSQNLGF